MVPTTAPMAAAMTPRISDLPDRPAMMVSAKISTADISGGPIISDTTAIGAATTNSTMSLKVSPNTEA